MALSAGTTALENGSLTKGIYEEFNSAFGTVSGAGDTTRRQIAAAIAKAVVDHIKTSADVVVTTSHAGLQRVSGTPTDAPAAPVTLAGAVD